MNLVNLLSFKNYLSKVYDSKVLISDSGTAQEEPALLSTPVIVPRDFTERPESVENYCSFMIDVNTYYHQSWDESLSWITKYTDKVNPDWMGDGTTAQQIINILKSEL